MNSPERITLNRDVQAVQIPEGTALSLRAGTQVRLLQSLGGSFTVVSEMGYMARIEGKDADALGKEPPPAAPGAAGEGQTLEQKIWGLLKTCYDPEIPVNIVDLGLVYSCRIQPLAEGAHRVEIQMTLTAPGCGMGSFLANDIHAKLLSLASVKEADVQLVLDPPWDQSKMSEAARLQLGLL